MLWYTNTVRSVLLRGAFRGVYAVSHRKTKHVARCVSRCDIRINRSLGIVIADRSAIRRARYFQQILFFRISDVFSKSRYENYTENSTRSPRVRRAAPSSSVPRAPLPAIASLTPPALYLTSRPRGCPLLLLYGRSEKSY